MATSPWKFFNRTLSEAAGFGMGSALRAPLEPTLQELTNLTWELHPNRPLDAEEVAEIVAEDVELLGWGEKEATQTGINKERFDALTEAVKNAPGFGELIRILRRHPNGGDDFIHGLRKARLEERWDALLEDLQHERLDPAVIANAIQQGFMHDAGVLPVTPDQTPGKVTTEPPADLDTLREAKAGGYDVERLKVLARLAGLPPGPQALASMVFRSIIEQQDYSRGVGQGHTKNEWADALLEYSRQIPTVTNFIEGRLRGWLVDSEMYTGTALHGMSQADTDLLFKVHGRPLSMHQVWIGLQRGGVYNGPTGDIHPAFLHALQQSNIRPEWYNLAWHGRYSYPSAFVMRALAEDGTLTAAETEADLLDMGWRPDRARQIALKWAAGSSTTSKGLTVTDLTAEYEGLTMTPAQYVAGLKELGYSQAAADAKVRVSDAKRARQARNQLINRARIRYTGWHISRQAASDALRAAGLTLTIANGLLTYWDAERDINVHTLTEAQVVKAYGSNLMDRPTATTRLTEIGLAPADIATRLDE